jgi:hypothetical protein
MTDREYDTDLALWADSRARELASRIAITMIHLMKLEASPAHEPRAGWQETIAQQRGDIERLLADAPSLRPTLPRVIDSEVRKAKRVAAITLGSHGEQPGVDLERVRNNGGAGAGGLLPGTQQAPAVTDRVGGAMRA